MRILKLALYDVKALLRSKDILFWVIAWPIIWMLMTAFVFVPPGPHPLSLSVAIIDLDRGFSKNDLKNMGLPENITEEITRIAGSPENFTDKIIDALKDYAKEKGIELELDVIKPEDRDTAKGMELGRRVIKEKDIALVLVVPANASECYTLWIPVRLGILVKASNPTEEYMNMGTIIQPVTNMSAKVSLERINATIQVIKKQLPPEAQHSIYALYGIAFPVIPVIKPVKPGAVVDRSGILGWTTIGAVGYVAVLMSMTSAAGFFVYRKESGVLRRLMASPIRLRHLVAVDIVSTLIFEAISMAIIVVVGLMLGARIIINPMNPLHILALAIIALAALFTYGMGLLIAPFARSSRGASGMAVVISLILIFTTGIWWPPKHMLVGPLRAFAEVFPPSIAFDIVRDLIVWQRGLDYIMSKMITLSYGCLVLLAILVAMYYRRLERFVSKII